jgi:hypothetical protein
MIIRTLITFILFISISLVAYASNALPADLQFKGQPIDTLCFNDIPKNNKIALNNCGAAKEKYNIKSKNDELIAKGYIGYDWQDSTMPAEISGYSYYRFFKANEKHYWIYALNNGGGSGDFTSVYLVQRINGNTLAVQLVTGGDRCNGGVQDVIVNNGKLSYSVNLTAYDLATITKTHTKPIKAYDDLAACAVCCVAKAYYQADTEAKTNKLDYVQLEKAAAVSEMPDQGKYQACFNEIAMDYIKKSQSKLEPEALNTFVKKFVSQCIKS